MRYPHYRACTRWWTGSPPKTGDAEPVSGSAAGDRLCIETARGNWTANFVESARKVGIQRNGPRGPWLSATARTKASAFKLASVDMQVWIRHVGAPAPWAANWPVAQPD